MKNFTKHIVAFFISVAAVFCNAQTPQTDVWTCKIVTLDGEKPAFSAPVNITKRRGYDNQPFFSYDNQWLFYSRASDTQNDIWAFDFVVNAARPVTATGESEFSPKESPTKRYLTTVRIDKDSVQRIWKFDQKDYSKVSLVDKTIDSIGYYTWVDHNNLAWFKITQPPTMWLTDIKSHKSQLIATDIGRTFLLFGKDTIITTIMKDNSRWIATIPLLNPKNVNYVVKCPVVETQDFVVVRLGSEKYIWTGVGKKIMCFQIGTKGKGWYEIADFDKDDIKSMSRLAISKDQKRIAFSSIE